MPESEDGVGERVREAVREAAPATVAWLDVTWCLPLLGWFHGPGRAGTGARDVGGPGLGDLPAAVVAAFLPGWEPGGTAPGREATGERVALVAAGRAGCLGDGGGSWAAPSGGGAGPGRVPQGAVALRDALADPAIGGFAVTWLAGRSAGEVEGAVAALLEHRDRDDVVIVALCGTDVDPCRLRGPLDSAAARRQLVVVDGDGAGTAADLALPGGDDPGHTRWVLASEPGPEPVAGHPALAAALAEGMRSGRADTDGDGEVSAEDAGRYLRRVLAVRPGVWATGTEPLVLSQVPAAAVPAPRAARSPEVARALRVARALDPGQALAAVQGLDAAQVLEVAQGLRIARLLDADPARWAAAPDAATARTPAATGRGGVRRRPIGELLVGDGLLTADQLEAALTVQRAAPEPRPWLGRVVVDLGLTTEQDVARCLAGMLNLQVVDLSKVVPAADVVRLLPRAVAERTRVIPVERTPGGGLVVAASDPTNVLAFDDVRLYTRCTDLTVYVATDGQIREHLTRAWSLGSDTTQVAEIVQEVAGEDDADPWTAGAEDEAPIVRLVTQILGDGVRLRASDIHVEVQRDTLRVRYRVDGRLRDVLEAPRRVATAVISRIKIISGLDIAERRVPQDGRTRLQVDGVAIDARVSTLPSLHGEKVVIRLLTRGDAVPPLAELGMEPDQLATLERALAVPQGLILITGPTGSGKTNTLYSAISSISSPELNVVTLEDPVEVQLPGITQVGVNEKTGMTFSRGLRSILRQDPDIILVGEVRDGETAELALKAAMTGHLVLTTLHTNSAVAAITRLVDMGVEPFAVASSLTLAVAQRLVRRPCDSCSEPYAPDELTLTMLGLVAADLDGGNLRRGVGCQECGGTGYRGRTGVYEILDVDAAMRQVLLKDATEDAISAQARAAGMVTLRASAILKALRGQTTLEEAVRVTHADHAGGHACPVCQRPVGSDMVACPWCAATLDRGQCPSCDRDLDPDWRICPWCRTPAVRAASAQPAAPQQAVPQQMVPQQAAVQQIPQQGYPPQQPAQYAPYPAQGMPSLPPAGHHPYG